MIFKVFFSQHASRNKGCIFLILLERHILHFCSGKDVYVENAYMVKFLVCAENHVFTLIGEVIL